MANAFCERLIGTIRREGLDHLIPINERHLRGIVKEFATHYNRGRPHSALGPEVPEPNQPKVFLAGLHRHKLPVGYGISTIPILAGLHQRILPEKGGCLPTDGVFAYRRWLNGVRNFAATAYPSLRWIVLSITRKVIESKRKLISLVNVRRG